MGMRRQDAITCKGGFSARVRRGENRIFEMERHLDCMREKLSILETMLPRSSNDFHNQANEPETDDNQEVCRKIREEKKLDKGQECVLQSLAVKEKKLRDEIFNMECKEKEYLQTLSKANVRHGNEEEMQKVNDEDNRDFTRVDNSSRNRKGESVEMEKISRLEEYSKKLCNCLRSIQNNRKIWSLQAGDLSKELNCLGNSGLKETSREFDSEGCEKIESQCPCGEPVKCDSCIICNCADWEQDLKINVEEKREEFNELKQKEVVLMKKKSDCRCFQSSSNSDASSQSLEINNIYKCSVSHVHSEMSIETPSIPSTVDGVITGTEEDKKNFCCLCKPEDDCQKLCEICLCDWDREYNTNRQLFSDDDENCHRCDICNEERFRGGTDFGNSINNEYYENCTENLTNILTSSICDEKSTREKISNDLEKKRFLIYPSQISKCPEIEEMKKNEIIAALTKEMNQTPILIRTEILKQPEKKEQSGYEFLTKDLAFGLFILLLTCLSCLLGFSGIYSLLIVSKLFFQIFIFPLQTCSQIYRNCHNIIQNQKFFHFRHFSIFCDNSRNFIFSQSKMIGNIFSTFQILANEKNNFENLILLCSFSCFGMIVIFLMLSENKFVGDEIEKLLNLRAIVTSFLKRIMNLILRPIIIFLFLIKFVLLLSVTVFVNLISSCVPLMISNVTYRMMNSSINVLLLLFKRLSTVSCTLHVICIILGFSLNKVLNLNHVNVHLENMRQSLKNCLCDSPEIDKTKNIPDNWINQFMKPSNFLNIFHLIIDSVINLAKMIFHTFEIR